MDKILLVLDKKDSSNKHMLEDIIALMKTRGSEIFYAFFIEIPLHYPIDTEHEYFRNDFTLAEQVLKNFEKEMNLKKISKSKLTGGIFKVRDLNFGIIEKALEYSVDLLIMPEKIMKSNSNANKFNKDFVVNKIMNDLNSSIMFWKDTG